MHAKRAEYLQTIAKPPICYEPAKPTEVTKALLQKQVQDRGPGLEERFASYANQLKEFKEQNARIEQMREEVARESLALDETPEEKNSAHSDNDSVEPEDDGHDNHASGEEANPPAGKGDGEASEREGDSP